MGKSKGIMDQREFKSWCKGNGKKFTAERYNAYVSKAAAMAAFTDSDTASEEEEEEGPPKKKSKSAKKDKGPRKGERDEPIAHTENVKAHLKNLSVKRGDKAETGVAALSGAQEVEMGSASEKRRLIFSKNTPIN